MGKLKYGKLDDKLNGKVSAKGNGDVSNEVEDSWRSARWESCRQSKLDK